MGWFGRKSAAAVRPFVPAWLGTSEEAGFVRSYDAQYDEVYRNNPVGQRCVRLLAGMVGGLAIDAPEGGEPALKLIGEAGLIERLAAALLLHGNAYVQLIAGPDDAPVELCPMRPERVSIVPDEHGYPAAYVYRAGNRAQRIAAKALAQSALARQWARRERLTLRLAPDYLDLVPGDVVRLPLSTQAWRVERATVEQMVVVAELKRLWRAAAAVPAEAGRAVGNYDELAPPTAIVLLDLPDLGMGQDKSPLLHLAAASGAREWRPVPIDITINGMLSTGQTAANETVLGTVIVAPAAGQAELIDEIATVEVELVGDAMWLLNCDDLALGEGANLAMVGNELIQFGRAEPIGPRRFRLSRLLRGRRGTDWATGSHVTGESFAMVVPGTLRPIELAQAALGAEVSVQARGLGNGATAPIVSRIAGGEALRPPSPVHLTAERRTDNGLDVRWVRRSRSGWGWLDSVDAPIGETTERYRVRLSGTAAAIELDAVTASASLSATDVALLGAGSATVAVSQIGDLAESREATLAILLT